MFRVVSFCFNVCVGRDVFLVAWCFVWCPVQGVQVDLEGAPDSPFPGPGSPAPVPRISAWFFGDQALPLPMRFHFILYSWQLFLLFLWINFGHQSYEFILKSVYFEYKKIPRSKIKEIKIPPCSVTHCDFAVPGAVPALQEILRFQCMFCHFREMPCSGFSGTTSSSRRPSPQSCPRTKSHMPSFCWALSGCFLGWFATGLTRMGSL